MRQFVVTRTRLAWAVLDRRNSYVVSECFDTADEARERAKQMNAREDPSAAEQTAPEPGRG